MMANVAGHSNLTMTRECKTRMADLTTPTTTIYGAFFIMGSVFTIIANSLVLIVLWMPSNRSRSNKILTSLAVSDLLVGLVVFPINAYQVLAVGGLINCPVDYTRVYFAVFLEGSSVLTLAVVAFDRFILMTKYNLYDKKSVKHLTVGLIVAAWLIPASAPAFRWVGRVPYLIFIFVIFFAPFFILFVSYFLIARALRAQELLLIKRRKESFIIDSSTTPGDPGDDSKGGNTGTDIPLDDITEIQTPADSKRKSRMRTEKAHIKLAKAVIWLLVVYFCCVTPKNIWIIVYLADSFEHFWDAHSHQNYYIFAMLAVSYNSFFNPIVYFWKNPQIRKGLKRLLRQSKNRLASMTNSSTMY
ncbi:rhodopsin-like [Clytia hemisphaerica]|uniref:G-protein coupled receptors family 1 profile domain-containing protein n=1 Tax=Clytia hemisphaerica TaxID=252671 RepID=A0A7M5XIG0_9CNID